MLFWLQQSDGRGEQFIFQFGKDTLIWARVFLRPSSCCICHLSILFFASHDSFTAPGANFYYFFLKHTRTRNNFSQCEIVFWRPWDWISVLSWWKHVCITGKSRPAPDNTAQPSQHSLQPGDRVLAKSLSPPLDQRWDTTLRLYVCVVYVGFCSSDCFYCGSAEIPCWCYCFLWTTENSTIFFQWCRSPWQHFGTDKVNLFVAR